MRPPHLTWHLSDSLSLWLRGRGNMLVVSSLPTHSAALADTAGMTALLQLEDDIFTNVHDTVYIAKKRG